MSNLRGYIIKELLDFDDDKNVVTSPYDVVYPITLIDAIFDQAGNSPERRSLKEILDDIYRRLEEGPKNWHIDFPVSSVNGITGDVTLTRKDFHIENVDNTSDMDKPLSTPQEEWLNENVIKQLTSIGDDLRSLGISYEIHAEDKNPHGLDATTLDQTSNNSLTKFINGFVGDHADDDNAHSDIRKDIQDVDMRLSGIVESNESAFKGLWDALNQHSGSDDHKQLFDAKEDKVNKVNTIISQFTENNGVTTILSEGEMEVMYPTVHAMVEYFEAYYQEAVKSITLENLDYVSSISCLPTDERLKNNSIDPEQNKRVAYIVQKSSRSGYKGNVTLATAKFNGNYWYWDQELLLRPTMLDGDYFEQMEGTEIWTFKKDANIVANINFDWVQTDTTYALGYRINKEAASHPIFELNDFAVETNNDNGAFSRLAERLLNTGKLDALKFKRQVVDELPAKADADLNTIYLLKDRNSENNVHTEYIIIINNDDSRDWEAVGTTKMEFDNLVMKDEFLSVTDVDDICIALGITPKPAVA